jgi:hypothetical protein
VHSDEEHTNRKDPFGASREEYRDMIKKSHILEDEIEIPSKRGTVIFVVRRK